MMRRMLLFMSLAIALNLSSLSQANTEPPNLAQLAPHLSLLNELSPQRRTNRFFINEQTALYGVQEGYVNVGRGNLTFLIRDLVTVGRIPIVAGRVYDSAAGAGGDFGIGWRLSLNESLVQQGKGFLYTDESGSPQTLLVTRQGFKPAHPSLSDIGSIKAKHGQIQLLMRSGWHKTFRRTGNGYQLSEVADANGNALVFEYQQGRLVKVQGDGRWIALQRNPDGTIASITDDQGRSVQYRYRDGQLSEVMDRGGQTWQFHYDTQRRLTLVTDPLQQTALTASYHHDGKVHSAAIRGSENHYAYQGLTTTMTDSEKNVHLYTQHPSGLTEQIINALGTISSLSFDQKLRATAVSLNGSVRHRFAYDRDGYLQQLSSHTGAQTQTFQYLLDWHHHKITEVTDQNQVTYQFRYDTRGNLKYQHDPSGITHYGYNRYGDLTEVQRPNQEPTQFEYTDDGQISHRIDAQGVTQFDYNPSGELIQVTQPDGRLYRYQYNELSLRTYSDVEGTITDYGYDALGRLVSVGNGNAQITYRHNEHNLITAIASPGDPTTEIGYNTLGNVSRYGIAEQSHHYRYDAVGRFIEVNPSHGDTVQQTYGADEADWRARSDSRTAIHLSPEHTASGVYGSYTDIFLGRSQAMKLSSARYEPNSKTLQAIGQLGFVAPDAGITAMLSRSQLESKAQGEQNQKNHDATPNAVVFNRPSNSFFLPPEFRANNCFVACDMVDSNLSVDIGVITAGSFARFSLESESRDQFNYNLAQIPGPTAPAALLQGCGAQVLWDMGDGNLFNRPVDTASGGFNDNFTYQSRLSHFYPDEGTYLVSALSYCSCFGVVSTASVALVVDECSDSDYEWHMSSDFRRNSFWVDDFVKQQNGNIKRIFNSFIAYPWTGDVFRPYADQRAPSVDEFRLATTDISLFWQTDPDNSCGSPYEVDIFLIPIYDVQSSVSDRDSVYIAMASDLGGTPVGRAAVGGNRIWLKNVLGLRLGVPAHEFGHNLGFHNRPVVTYDMMYEYAGSASAVLGYHARVLYERY